MDLPDTWIDRSILPVPFYWLKVLWASWRYAKHPVILPDGIPGKEWIPSYVFQPFHNLPNGNYSNRISHGYIAGFDHAMLGEMAQTRKKLARHFHSCSTVLDLGCGGGRLAQAIHESGVDEVWALDPSPYLLRHAARRYPALQFVQGIAEQIPFDAAHFDGVSACFLFHELPPSSTEQALMEISRVLKPNGVLAIAEPSRLQLTQSVPQLLRHYGWRGIYFRLLAKYVNEPFMRDWHNLPLRSLLAKAGLKLVGFEESMRVTTWIAKKTS